MAPIRIKGTLFLENGNLYVRYDWQGTQKAKVDDRSLSPELAELKKKSIYHFQQPVEVALQFRTLRSNGSPSTVERYSGQHEHEITGDFHNAYQFVPRPPRTPVIDDDDLGDHAPDVGLEVLAPDRWTGTIRVQLTTQTPLLIADAQQVRTLNGETVDDPRAHKIYPVRLDAKGMPYLPPTTLKGALRSAFEIVTNSRFGVFGGHDVPLAYRTPAGRETLDLVPVRIEEQGGGLVARLLTGTTYIRKDGHPDDSLGYAAKLFAYDKKAGPMPHRDSKIGSLKHGQQVRARIYKGKSSWLVADVKSAEEPRPLLGESKSATDVDGWLSRTNKSIDGKMYEQIFFSTEPDDKQACAQLTPEVLKLWEVLVANYQAEHADEIARGDTKPSNLKHSKWSRHITIAEARTLKVGDLCYARVSVDSGKPVIDELVPVMVSRQLYAVAPADCLDRSLAPAAKISELSPADRLFGWVNPAGHGALRGRVRVGRILCGAQKPEEAIELFDGDGVPLSILGPPKPQQERFYAASSAYGTPLARHSRRGTGFSGKDAGLRGQKVYPHHRDLPSGYWDSPQKDRTGTTDEKGWAQEYRRPDGTDGPRSSQNRSVTSWVKAGVPFTCDLFVQNLSDFELGALLWILGMPEDHFFRVGGGKPLGFGSVRIEWEPDASSLGKSEGWARHWSSLGMESADDGSAAPTAQLAGQFETRVREGYSDAIGYGADFLEAFLVASRGFHDGKPVHYPRARPGTQLKPGPQAQDPRGENYEWFAANERRDYQRALPLLTEDEGLQYLPGDVEDGTRRR